MKGPKLFLYSSLNSAAADGGGLSTKGRERDLVQHYYYS